MKSNFLPVNDFEKALLQTKAGNLAISVFIQTFLRASIAVPSGREIEPNGHGFEPLIFPKEGVDMISVFSDNTRIGDFSKLAPYCLVMKGSDLLKTLAPGCGIVVNPGSDEGLELSPSGIEKIKADFF